LLVACFLGAALICIDLVVRKFPGKQNFRIENSNGFLSSSLSLSFGVMVGVILKALLLRQGSNYNIQLFSSLYKMLPSARHSLEAGGLSVKAASWTLIALFFAGAGGIQILSKIMHHMLPSHVVDCDHTHEGSEAGAEMESCPDDEESQMNKTGNQHMHDIGTGTIVEVPPATIPNGVQQSNPSAPRELRRPGPQRSRSMWNSLLASSSYACDSGDCYGYSNPCGNCFKNVQAGIGVPFGSSRPQTPRSFTDTPVRSTEHTPLLQSISEDSGSSTSSSTPNIKAIDDSHMGSSHQHDHHHHVPENAFLSIGLQTSIAIALHKLPEGFITYATNHANPRLGVAIFISLFVHNITEGFALALPLYLALHSRPKAMIWSAILGGVSQPLGAGIAALWFHIAGSNDMAPGEAVYGGMFAIVAGIMTSVALQLMGESLELTHDRDMCFIFAFIGMGILGASSALIA
jgi:zinc transporter, ZIP family